MKPLFFFQNTRYFHVEIVPQITRPKCHMIYVCDVTVFDEQTNMAENEEKRLKHEAGRKLALLASKSLAHLKLCAREMTRRFPMTAMLSNTVTSQTQFSSPVSRDTFMGKLAVFRPQKKSSKLIFFAFSKHYSCITYIKEGKYLKKNFVSCTLQRKSSFAWSWWLPMPSWINWQGATNDQLLVESVNILYTHLNWVSVICWWFISLLSCQWYIGQLWVVSQSTVSQMLSLGGETPV